MVVMMLLCQAVEAKIARIQLIYLNINMDESSNNLGTTFIYRDRLEKFPKLMHVGGLDNILFTPNGRLHKLLTKLAFTNLLHPFQPFIIGQKLIGPKIANKFDIKLVFYGENQAIWQQYKRQF